MDVVVDSVAICKYCKNPIRYGVGRGTKPSGKAWRHLESGAQVCPGTFRAEPKKKTIKEPPNILNATKDLIRKFDPFGDFRTQKPKPVVKIVCGSNSSNDSEIYE